MTDTVTIRRQLLERILNWREGDEGDSGRDELRLALAAPVQEQLPVRWTGYPDADLALNLLDRIDAPNDEIRIEQLEQIVMRMGKALVAAPVQTGVYSDDPLACSGCASGCFRCLSEGAAPVQGEVVADEREAFEAAVCERYGYTNGSIESRRIGNHYCDSSLSQAWALWQARAALSTPPQPAEAGELVDALRDAERHERHRNNGETRFWCDQYKRLARAAVAQHQRIVAQRDAKLAVLSEAMKQYASDENWCYDTCNISRDVARAALATAGVGDD